MIDSTCVVFTKGSSNIRISQHQRSSFWQETWYKHKLLMKIYLLQEGMISGIIEGLSSITQYYSHNCQIGKCSEQTHVIMYIIGTCWFKKIIDFSLIGQQTTTTKSYVYKYFISYPLEFRLTCKQRRKPQTLILDLIGIKKLEMLKDNFCDLHYSLFFRQ